MSANLTAEESSSHWLSPLPPAREISVDSPPAVPRLVPLAMPARAALAPTPPTPKEDLERKFPAYRVAVNDVFDIPTSAWAHRFPTIDDIKRRFGLTGKRIRKIEGGHNVTTIYRMIQKNIPRRQWAHFDVALRLEMQHKWVHIRDIKYKANARGWVFAAAHDLCPKMFYYGYVRPEHYNHPHKVALCIVSEGYDIDLHDQIHQWQKTGALTRAHARAMSEQIAHLLWVLISEGHMIWYDLKLTNMVIKEVHSNVYSIKFIDLDGDHVWPIVWSLERQHDTSADREWDVFIKLKDKLVDGEFLLLLFYVQLIQLAGIGLRWLGVNIFAPALKEKEAWIHKNYYKLQHVFCSKYVSQNSEDHRKNLLSMTRFYLLSKATAFHKDCERIFAYLCQVCMTWVLAAGDQPPHKNAKAPHQIFPINHETKKWHDEAGGGSFNQRRLSFNSTAALRVAMLYVPLPWMTSSH